MYRFYGSSNSRYFLVDKDRTISLYHDDHPLWSEEAPREEYTVLGVGNNGSVALWFNSEIYLYPEGKGDAGEAVKSFSPEALEQSSAYLDGAFLDQNGTRLCVCRVTSKSKVSEKLFGALASVRAEKGLKEFEILFYDITTSEMQSIYKIVHPAGGEKYFKWSISREFNYIVVGNPKKTPSGAAIKYSIVDTNNNVSVRSFELQDIEVNKIFLNSDGTVLLDAYQKGVHSLLIVTKDKTSFNITPPGNSEILHLARSYVAFHLVNPPILYAKTFDNNDLSRISLEKVYDLGIPYGILFNVRDSIIFLYFKEQQLCIAYTELSTFLTEVKRCELTRQQRVQLGEAPVEIGQDVQYSDEQSFLLPFLMEQKASAQKSTPDTLAMPQKKEVPTPAEDEIPAPPVHEKKEPLQAISISREKQRVPDVKEEVEKDIAPPPQKEEKHYTTPEKMPDKTELYKRLESLKLQHVMGMIDDNEYQEKKQKIESLIKKIYAIKELTLTSELESIIKKEQEAGEPVKEVQETPLSRADAEREESDDPVKQRMWKLLESMEERFILGEINENTYKELKTKYQRTLGTKKLSSSQGSPEGEQTTEN